MIKNILVFAAHPDDDIIGCGGSLAKHIQKGNLIIVCYMTSGGYETSEHTEKEMSKIREDEARNAAKIIGIQKLVFLRNKNGFLEFNEKSIRQIISLIRKEEPHIIYVHHSLDGHRDHRVTYELLREATRKAGLPFSNKANKKQWGIETILAYEVWRPISQPNYIEDISDFIGKKISAMQEHKSQVKWKKLDEASEALAKYRGIMSGKGCYCEAFEVLKAASLF